MSLTSNILRPKKSLIGGINKLYLFPYVKYSRSQITIEGQSVVSFPITTIYQVEGVNLGYNETTEVEGGDVAFNQSLTVDVLKTNEGNELYTLLKQNFRAIYIDRIGNIRILGLYNGLETQYNNDTATDKAGFNGYKLTLSGRENNQAYYLANLEDFTIYTDNNYELINGCNYEFINGENYVLL